MGILNSFLAVDTFREIDSFASFIGWLDGIVWGPLMLILIVGTGIFITLRLKFRPWRNLGYALRSIFRKQDKAAKEAGDISPFQSLMTALYMCTGSQIRYARKLTVYS